MAPSTRSTPESSSRAPSTRSSMTRGRAGWPNGERVANAGAAAAEVRRLHLGGRRAALVEVDVPHEPYVREGREAVGRRRAVERAGREHELRGGGRNDGALTRRAEFLGPAARNVSDGLEREHRRDCAVRERIAPAVGKLARRGRAWRDGALVSETTSDGERDDEEDAGNLAEQRGSRGLLSIRSQVECESKWWLSGRRRSRVAGGGA